MQQYYYTRTSRKILIALLDLFNNIKVYNYDSYGNAVSFIDVPLKYGPSEKYHQFDLQLRSGKKYYPKVPSMLMTLDSISYDSDRATSVNEIRSLYNPAIDVSYIEDFWSDVQPTPYNFTYSLEIRTESMDHLFQIQENILPFFNPTNHLKIKEFDFLNLERNLRVSMDGVSMDYPKEMSEEESRYFNSTITLNVNAYLYRPIDMGKVIKFVKTRYFYDKKNAETYSTSAMSIYQQSPSDFSYKTTSGDTEMLYTKVGDYNKPIIEDNIWDGRKEQIDPDAFVFVDPQPVISETQGVGEYPDGGTESISAANYTFNDGTYADGQNV